MLDIERPEALTSYLRGRGLLRVDEEARTRVLAGGVSNRTVLLLRPQAPDWVLKQALDTLRVAVPWHCDPRRAHREAVGLQWLQKTCPSGSIPGFVFEDATEHLLAMEAVPEPHAVLKEQLLAGQIDHGLLRDFGGLLGVIHAHGAQGDAEALFADQSFFEALRLEPYYEYSAAQEPSAAPFLRELIDDARSHRVTVVHGDYSPKNILVRQGKLVLLDHEVIHFGSPAFDIGFAFAHLLSKAHHLRAHRTELVTGAQLAWDGYRAAIADARWAHGDEFERTAVRHTLGCLLARVVGRSPLEYLDAHERRRQRAASLKLIESPPSTMPELIRRFPQEVE